MSLVVLATAQARAGAGVTQDMIDEEEAWLAAAIGPLTGEISETFYDPKISGTIDAVYLSRRTALVDAFTSDGTALTVETDWRLISGYIIEQVEDSTAAWEYPLVAAYTPNDQTIIEGVIYDLLAYRQLPANIQSIRIGQYSETYGTGKSDPVRTALLGKVLTSAGLGAYGIPFRVKRHARDRSRIEASAS